MTDSSADRDPLDRLAEEFVARLRRGEHPAVSEYAERHPELAEQVRELFPALVEMEQLKPVSGELTGAYGPAAEPGDPPRVGEFRILRRVGHGGMGVVYEAVQESLDRHVALKLLPAGAVADPNRLERFRREARAAARLHHTNIVPVFGVGEADGRHYYAMQFIPGHPLDAVVAEVRRLKEKSALLPAAPRAVSEVAAALVTGTFARSAPADLSPEVPPAPAASSPALSGTASGGHGYWATVARIGAQVADALAYAHGQGVLHRDVKPANLLLDPTGTVWVTDFGLAKSADADDLTHAGDIVGTLRYMAPERFEGAGDGRADIYALGLMLYELLTLRPAFAAENRAKLVQEVMDAHPPRPRSVNATIPRDLETIVLKATARDAGARYPTAAALADDLRRFLDGRTITARRVGSAERLWRWAKRAPAVASLLVLTVVLLAAGTTVSTVFAVRADTQRKAADDARKDADDRADDLKAEQERMAALLYASESHQASTAAHEYRTTRLLELLEATRPKPGRPDLRGWEWHYLDRAAHPWDTDRKFDSAGVPGFAAGRSASGAGFGFGGVGLVGEGVFSANGTRLVVPPIVAHVGIGFGGGSQPAAPGGVFAVPSGAALRPIRPPDAPGVTYTSPLGGHAAPAGAVSPDGRFLAHAEQIPGPAPAKDGAPAPPAGFRVTVTDLETGREAVPPLDVPVHPMAVAVGPGAGRVVVLLDPMLTASLRDGPDAGPPPGPDTDPRAVVWERAGGAVRTRVLRHPDRDRKSMPLTGGWALSPDGSTAAVVYIDPGGPPGLPGAGGGAAVIEVHDLAGPAGPPRVVGSPAGFLQPVFSAGGAALAVWEGADGRTVRTLDARSGRAVGRWAIPAAVPLSSDITPHFLCPLAVSDDGRRVATDTGTGLVVVGEQARAESPAQPGGGERWRVAVLRRPTAPNEAGTLFTRLWLAPDGSEVASAAPDGTVRTRALDPFPGFDTTWPDELVVDGVACQPVPTDRGRRVVYNPTPGGFVGGGFGGMAGFQPRPPAQPVALYDPRGSPPGVVGKHALRGDPSRVGASPDGRRCLVVVTPEVVGPPSPTGRLPPQEYHLLALDRPRTAPLLARVIPASENPSAAASVALSDGGRWVLEPDYGSPTAPPPGPGESFSPVVYPERYRVFSAETGAPAGTLPPGPRDWDGLSHYGPLHGAGDRLVLVHTHPKAPARATGPDRPPPVPVTVRCYDAEGGHEVWTWAVPEPTPWTRFSPETGYTPVLPILQFSPDGRWVAAAWVGGGGVLRVRVLGAGTGEDFGELSALPADGVGAEPRHVSVLAFGPGRRLMVGDGRDALVWDGPDRPGVRLRGHDQEVAAGVFSADGRRLFTLDGKGPNRLIHVWDLATRREVLTLREPHAGGGFGYGYGLRSPLWLEGDRLKLMTTGGVLAFDGTPREGR